MSPSIDSFLRRQIRWLFGSLDEIDSIQDEFLEDERSTSMEEETSPKTNLNDSKFLCWRRFSVNFVDLKAETVPIVKIVDRRENLWQSLILPRENKSIDRAPLPDSNNEPSVDWDRSCKSVVLLWSIPFSRDPTSDESVRIFECWATPPECCVRPEDSGAFVYALVSWTIRERKSVWSTGRSWRPTSLVRSRCSNELFISTKVW